MNNFQLFTDGACEPNPGNGGWGFILRRPDGSEIERSGRVPDTTNNRMEMTAVIEGLKLVPIGAAVEVVSDSQYVTRGCSEWMVKWKSRRWMKGQKPIKNVDLWRQLDELLETMTATFKWVRGHEGHAENERCDQLAGQR